MDTKGAMDYWTEEMQPLSDGTRRSYLFHFNRFVLTQGLTADGLLELQREALKSEDPRDRRRVTLILRNYMVKWQEEGISPSTAKNAAKALKSFFEANETEFTLKNKDKPKVDYDGQKMIQPGQIKTLYMNPGFERDRNRALIMFAKDSGLRVSDLSQLRVKHWQEAEDVKSPTGEVFKVFNALLTEKTKINAYIHVGPETVEVMKAYLKLRRDLDPSQPLFASRTGKAMSSMALIVLFRRLCDQLGVKKISAHSFRKFHRTMLQEAQMNDKWILILQGKASDAYTRPQDSDRLTTKYIECYDKLRVHDSAVTADYERDKEIARLKAEAKARDEALKTNEAEWYQSLKELEAENARLRAEGKARDEVLVIVQKDQAALKGDVESRLEQLKREVMKELDELDKLEKET